MQKISWSRILALLFVALALSGCMGGQAQPTLPAPTAAAATARQEASAQTSPAAAFSTSEAVSALLLQRMQAVSSKDDGAYLATVLPSDAVLQKEESNLIRAAQPLDIEDYRLTAGPAKEDKSGRLVAQVTQSYRIGAEAHSCTFDAAFVPQNGKLYWDGPEFDVKSNDRVRVSYTGSDAALAQSLLDSETDILERFHRQLGFEPKGVISIKLFQDQQVFLQSVKLDLPAWVGGWHEFGESIKSFTGGYGSDPSGYKPMLAHESTHRMVSELSNDNACYWLQEGLAGIYEGKLLDPDEGWLTADEARQTFNPYAQQKTIDLEKISADDRDAVMRYYATAKAFASFLLDSYGWQKVRQMLEYMQKYDLIPVTSAEKIEETNRRTSEALSAVLGLSDDAFQTRFDQWIGKRR